MIIGPLHRAVAILDAGDKNNSNGPPPAGALRTRKTRVRFAPRARSLAPYAETDYLGMGDDSLKLHDMGGTAS